MGHQRVNARLRRVMGVARRKARVLCPRAAPLDRVGTSDPAILADSFRSTGVIKLPSAPARLTGGPGGGLMSADDPTVTDSRGKMVPGPKKLSARSGLMHRNKNRSLFDDLVSAQPDRWGYRKAERLGGLEVQDHLKILSAA